jgi:hypothetical protein
LFLNWCLKTSKAIVVKSSWDCILKMLVSIRGYKNKI